MLGDQCKVGGGMMLNWFNEWNCTGIVAILAAACCISQQHSVRNIQIHGSHIQLGMKHIIKVILTGRPTALIHHANAIITHHKVHPHISTPISTLA